MSIKTLDFSVFKQNFSIKDNNKQTYGEVHTDFKIVEKMLDLIPVRYFKDSTLKWLDPCAGRGYFAMILYKKLFKHLKQIKDHDERHSHIVNNMIFIVELNSEFILDLQNLFGEKNINHCDFLKYEPEIKFDFVIGNPPYNNYLFKNQCNYTSVWQAFIKKAFELVKDKGHVLFITPSIWMKNTHPSYQFMIHNKLKRLHTMSKIKTNQEFQGNAQVPSSYFLAMKTGKKIEKIKLYDDAVNKYINFDPNYKEKGFSIPLSAASIIEKMQKYVRKYGFLDAIKTNLRPERHDDLTVSENISPELVYKNIKTCHIDKKTQKTVLIIEYSNKQCPFQDEPKIVLPHKMYGYSYYDKQGEYGCSGRDNYVIIGKKDAEFEKLHKFFCTRLWLTLTDAARYRQSFLDKQVFSFFPDITKIPDFPEEITETSIYNYFDFSEVERNFINSHKMACWLNKF